MRKIIWYFHQTCPNKSLAKTLVLYSPLSNARKDTIVVEYPYIARHRDPRIFFFYPSLCDDSLCGTSISNVSHARWHGNLRATASRLNIGRLLRSNCTGDHPSTLIVRPPGADAFRQVYRDINYHSKLVSIKIYLFINSARFERLCLRKFHVTIVNVGCFQFKIQSYVSQNILNREK